MTTFRFISAHGAGATLKVGLEENGTLALNGARYITSGLGDDYNLSGGSGYDLNDVLVAPAALLYELEETLMLRVRLHDPMNEVSQLKFYGNGVELDGISTTASGQTTMVFMPESEALSFVTARALYGDERDNPPAVMPVAGSSTILRSTERGEVATTRWGWNRNWQQQHMYDGNYPAPSWFWSGVNGYWSWPPEWLNLPDMPGALSAQSTASLLEEVDDNFSASMAFKFPAEDNSPEFSVGAEIPLIVEVNASELVEVHLFTTVDLNESYLGKMDEFNAGSLGGYRTGLFSYILNSYDREVVDLENTGKYILTARAYPVGGFDFNATQAEEEEEETDITDQASREITINPFAGSLPPLAELRAPGSGASTTSTSTVRLEANAHDPDGNLEGMALLCKRSGDLQLERIARLQ